MASKSIDWDTVLVTKDPKKKEVSVNFKAVDGFKPEVISPGSLCVTLASTETFTHITGSAHWVWAKLDKVPDRYVKVRLDFDAGNGIGEPDTPQFVEWFPGDDQLKQVALSAGVASELLNTSNYRATATIDGSSCPVAQATVEFAKDVIPPDPDPDPIPDVEEGGDPLPGDNPECLPQDCDAWDNARLDVNVNTTGVVLLRVATDPTFSSCTTFDFNLWNGIGNTTPNQAIQGYRALHPDGTPSNFGAPYDATQPNSGFGSAYPPVQNAVGTNNPCITNPNVIEATDRWYNLDPFDTFEGIAGTMSIPLSAFYTLGRIGWPFSPRESYSTTQYFSDYVFLEGSTIGSNNRYNAQAVFDFTACTAPVPPTDGTTAPYFAAVATANATLEFRQTTAGTDGKFEIWVYEPNTTQYNRIADDTFLKGGDFLKIETQLSASPFWDAVGGNDVRNLLELRYTVSQTIKNLTTGQSVPASTSFTDVQGTQLAFFYCVPMHPTCTDGPGLLTCYADTGTGMTIWRIAIGGDVTSDTLIERTITNYIAPTHCTRIP